MNWIKRNSLVLAMFFAMVISVFTSSNVRWGDQRWHKIIDHDANGYYSYLPAIFIYKDLNFNFYDNELKDLRKTNTHLVYDYREDYNGVKVNKYYIGTALAELPFFLTAHLLSSPLGFESNGYSKIYYVFISLAAIFYALLGLWFFQKTLQFYQISKTHRALLLLTLYLGTHLFYYTNFEAGMSHTFSFAFISMLLFFGKKYFREPQLKTALIVSSLLAIITLLRPVNVLIVLIIPFLAGGTEALKNGLNFLFKRNLLNLIYSLLPFFAIIFIQLLIYKIATGQFIVYSYTEEGFNFLDPHFIDILFSYKKGLFLYTPLCLLAMVGAYFLYKTNRFEAISLLLFLVVLTYVLSSWWNWYYGGSFSSRVYVDFLSIFGILLAFLWKGLNDSKLYKPFIVLVFFLVLFNQKQTYLYRVAYIHWIDMDKEKYWKSIPYPLEKWTNKSSGSQNR